MFEENKGFYDWTFEDQDEASVQGWKIGQSSGSEFMIKRCGFRFPDNASAYHYVSVTAVIGNLTAWKALRYMARTSQALYFIKEDMDKFSQKS